MPHKNLNFSAFLGGTLGDELFFRSQFTCKKMVITPSQRGLMDIVGALLDSRSSISEISLPNATGVYAIFAKNRDCLPEIVVPENGVVYVGMTRDSLASRNHFVAKKSGFNSPRRSLGAILKQELNLTAVPRSSGAAATNVNCYAFSEDGEQRLTRWMHHNLDYAVVELKSDLSNVEKAVISEMQPPLNLKGWRNPQKRHIMDLRSACKAEAKAARSQTLQSSRV